VHQEICENELLAMRHFQTFPPSDWKRVLNICTKLAKSREYHRHMRQMRTHPPEIGVVSTRMDKLFFTEETCSTGVRTRLHQGGSPSNRSYWKVESAAAFVCIGKWYGTRNVGLIQPVLALLGFKELSKSCGILLLLNHF